jgi:putative transposase
MARAHRLKMAGLTQHVIQRGNNRSDIFRDRDDYEFFLAVLERACKQEDVAVHNYVLMTNHVHMVMTPRKDAAVSLLMQAIGRFYVLHFNRRHARTGALFEGRYRSFVVDTDSYFFKCMRYVELNPVRAGLVTQPADYPWCSYRANALGASDGIVNPHGLYTSLGSCPSSRQANWREICAEGLPENQLAEIRTAVQRGGALGRVILEPDSGEFAS